MANNAGTAKPVALTGAIYVGEANSTHLPTDVTTAMSSLSQYYKSVGYISDDGVVNSYSMESDEVKCWGGATVLTMTTGRTDNWQFTMISPRNIDALKLVYGATNVTESSGAITVTAKATEPEAHSFVIDAIIGGVARRICIPNAKVSETGDIVYKDDEALGYEVTISALANSDDVTHFEYNAAEA